MSQFLLALLIIAAALLVEFIGVYLILHPPSRAALRRFYTVCLRCTYRALGLHMIPDRHRRTVHLSILGLIAYDLLHVGFKIADMGFLVLSFLMEAENAIHHDPDSDRHAWLPTPALSSLTDRIIGWRASLPKPPQTDPLSIPLPNAACYLPALIAFAHTHRIKVYLSPSEWPAVTPPWWNFSDGARAFSTKKPHLTIALSPDATDPAFRVYLVLHELGHLLTPTGRDSNKTLAEVSAELVPFLLFNRLGWTDTLPAEYLASYLPDPSHSIMRDEIQLITESVLPVVDTLYTVLTSAPCHGGHENGGH